MNASSIAEWLDLFNRYGWPAVMFVFIVFAWFIPWIKKMNARLDNTDQITDKEHDLTMITQCDIEINQLLAQAAVKSGAQRTALWQFHNGGTTIGGVSFVRTSITHEYVTEAVQPMADRYQGLPIGLFADVLGAINENDCVTVEIGNTKHLVVENLYRTEGIACGGFYRMCNSRNLFIGFLAIYYTDCRPITLDINQAMQGFSSRIAQSLGVLASYRTSSTHPRRRMSD
jgi:hypothetical protein